VILKAWEMFWVNSDKKDDKMAAADDASASGQSVSTDIHYWWELDVYVLCTDSIDERAIA